MTTLMSAADEPRLRGRGIDNRPPVSSLPAFDNDAERCIWIAAECKRRIKPGINKAKLARDIAAAAFEITVAQLLSPSRERSLTIARQKIICLTRLLTGLGPRQLGKLFNRDHSTIIHSSRKYRDEIAALLKDHA